MRAKRRVAHVDLQCCLGPSRSEENRRRQLSASAVVHGGVLGEEQTPLLERLRDLGPGVLESFGQRDASVAIPVGGLFSGHNTAKTAAEVEAFGGTLGASLDPCYHLACDTLDNIDPESLADLARAGAWVTGYLASGEVTVTAAP